MNGLIVRGRVAAWSRNLMTASAVVLTAAAVGCGSDSTEEGAGAAAGTTASSNNGAAAKIVAAASQPITAWDGFGEPIKPPTGKRVVAIECSSLGVGCVQGAEAVKEAGQTLGWTTDIVNGKGDPTVWNSAIQTAVSGGADGIVLFAISPALVKDGIAKAKAAGVPVAAAFVGPKADALSVVDAEASGKIMAGYLAEAAAGGEGNTLVLNDGEFSLTAERNTAMIAELAKLCPKCKTKKVEFTFATMPTKLAGQVAAALQADPTINRVTMPFDAAATFVRQGIQQSGSKAKIASFEGDPPVLKTVGDGVQDADLASPNVWTGWQAVDNLARLMTNNPVSDAPLPVRLFTAQNKAEAADWDGDLDFRAKYAELWGK